MDIQVAKPVRHFLRSPPFPGIASARAAISRSLGQGEAPTEVGDQVLDALMHARVGGTFWGPRPRGFRLIVRHDATPSADLLASFRKEEIGIVGGRTAGALSSLCDPWTLVGQAEAVCAAPDDELAIVAGLLGKPVFDDGGLEIARETLRLHARILIAGARYRDCFADTDIGVDDVITLLADWRRHIDGNQDIAAASGMAFWKRDALRRFLWDGTRSPPFLSLGRGLSFARRTGGMLAIWPSRVPSTLARTADGAGVPIVQVEDGFIRSRGLGAGLHPPRSVVIDRTGLYYDARSSNDLEHLLAHHSFPAPLIARAAKLRRYICATGVTKYGAQSGLAMEIPPGRRTVLAVGQVDDDLSISLGGAGIAGNLDFLSRVRRAEPHSWIVYRPHPDVQAGHRRGHLSEAAILRYADSIDSGAPLMALVQSVDEVHVLSSLTGFEALMRDRPVTVHGMPFYAGWGLTRDLAPANPRRGRSLSVDQLVAGALILYPRYLDPVTELPCGPELLVNRMATGNGSKTSLLVRLQSLQGKLRRFMTLSAEFFHG